MSISSSRDTRTRTKSMNTKENGLSIQEASLVLTGFIYHLLTYLLNLRSNKCSPITTEVTPSFILLAIQGSKVVTYVYEMHGDQVDVSKSEFSKVA